MKHLANMHGCTSPKVPNQFPKCQLPSINTLDAFYVFHDTWLLNFFSSFVGWIFTSAITVPRPKYSQPSFSSLKTSFFFLCISQLESWNLKALHKYLLVKDIRSDFQFAHFSWGGRRCWLGKFFFFFLKQFCS